jgi:protein-tyrosine-phosphatase
VGDVLHVVFVCSGNRARSPLAEALFRNYSRGLPTAVSSLGTLDVGSLPALPFAVEAGRRLGVDLTSHQACSLRGTDLSASDLVLGFEPLHVSAAIVDAGANPARSFLLGELAMLVDGSLPGDGSVARARAVVADADSRRVRYRPDRAAVVVGDPVGKRARAMRRTATEIDGLVQQILTGLFGVHRPMR